MALDQEDENKKAEILDAMQPYIEKYTNEIRKKIIEYCEDAPSLKVPSLEGTLNAPALVQRFTQVLISKVTPISDDTAASFSGKYYLEEFNDYLDLVCELSTQFQLRPNKATYCLFVGITVVLFNSMIENGTEEQKGAFSRIDSCLVNDTISSMESRSIDSKSGKFRLESKGVGHDIATQNSLMDAEKALISDMKEQSIRSIIKNAQTAALVNKKAKKIKEIS